MIDERGKYLEQLVGYTHSEELKCYANFETFVVPCFHNLRQITVAIIEKVQLWRKLQSMKAPYLFQGRNYLVELTKDASKIIFNSDLQVFSRLDVFLNDFVFFIPKEGNEVLEDLKKLLKVNKGLELAEVQFFDTICKNLQLSNEDEQAALHQALICLVKEDKICKEYKKKKRDNQKAG